LPSLRALVHWRRSSPVDVSFLWLRLLYLSLSHGFFFLQLYGAPRHLHSFPTRRSSDLACRSSRLAVRISIKQACSRLTRPLSRSDRKSTRLNSSHGSISYAVFCLKKQKIRSSSPEYDRARDAGVILEGGGRGARHDSLL